MAWETTVVQIQHGLTVTHYQLSRLLPKDRFCWRCWFQTGLCLNTHVSQHAMKSHCAWCPSLHTASQSCAVNEQWNNSGRGRKRRPTLWDYFWYSLWWTASALSAHSLLCTSRTVIRCGWVAKKVAAADLGEGEVILLWKTGHLYGEAGKEEWQPVLGDTGRLPRKSGGSDRGEPQRWQCPQAAGGWQSSESHQNQLDQARLESRTHLQGAVDKGIYLFMPCCLNLSQMVLFLVCVLPNLI